MIRFYDLSFNFIGETNVYTSLQFNRNWYGCGDFELHINRYSVINARPAVLLWDVIYATINDPLKELIIQVDGDEKKVGIVNFDASNFNNNGKISEDLILKGKELKYLSHRATVYPAILGTTYEITDNVETVIKTLIDDNQGPSAAAARQLTGLIIDTDTGEGDSIYYSAQNYPFLDVEIEKIATDNDVGWWYEFDGTNITVYFSEGRDCTRGQEIIDPVILDQFAGLAEGEYSHNDKFYYNVIIAKGKPENDTVTDLYKIYPEASIPTSFRRRELFKEFDVIITEAGDAFDNLDNAVAQYIAGATQELYLNGKALNTGAMQYETNYNLGDLIVIQAFGITQNIRITNIREIYEGDKYVQVELTFGQQLPTLPKLINTQINDIKKII